MAEIYQIFTRTHHIPEDILQQHIMIRPPHRSAHAHRMIQNTQPQELNANNVVPEPCVPSPYRQFTSKQQTNTITKICHIFKLLKQEFSETILQYFAPVSLKKKVCPLRFTLIHLLISAS
jgi:hypothetical protein